MRIFCLFFNSWLAACSYWCWVWSVMIQTPSFRCSIVVGVFAITSESVGPINLDRGAHEYTGSSGYSQPHPVQSGCLSVPELTISLMAPRSPLTWPSITEVALVWGFSL